MRWLVGALELVAAPSLPFGHLPHRGRRGTAGFADRNLQRQSFLGVLAPFLVKNKITQGVENVFSLVFFKRLHPVRMRANYNIGSVVYSRVGKSGLRFIRS